MGALTPWAVTATSTVEAGWTEDGCMECTQSDDSTLYQNVKVTQTPDCTKSILAASSQVSSPVYTVYNSALADVTIPMSSIFTFNYESFCGTVTCASKKYVAGCSIDNTAVGTDKVWMTGSSISTPYVLNYKRDVAGGYIVDRCIICESTSFPAGVGFHVQVIENTIAFTDQLFVYNATPKKVLATGFSAFAS
jgi:hypothetical protein